MACHRTYGRRRASPGSRYSSAMPALSRTVRFFLEYPPYAETVPPPNHRLPKLSNLVGFFGAKALIPKISFAHSFSRSELGRSLYERRVRINNQNQRAPTQ